MWRQQRGDRLVIWRHCVRTHNHPTYPGDTSESGLLRKSGIDVAHVLLNIFGQRVNGETVEIMECPEACHRDRPLSAHCLILLSKVGKLRGLKQKVIDGFWYLGLFCTQSKTLDFHVCFPSFISIRTKSGSKFSLLHTSVALLTLLLILPVPIALLLTLLLAI